MHAYRREKFNHHANYTTERKNDILATDAWKTGAIDKLENSPLAAVLKQAKKCGIGILIQLKYGLLWQKRPNKTPLQRAQRWEPFNRPFEIWWHGTTIWNACRRLHGMRRHAQDFCGKKHAMSSNLNVKEFCKKSKFGPRQVSIFMPARILIYWIMMPCF